jgi:hypothetical protein
MPCECHPFADFIRLFEYMYIQNQTYALTVVIDNFCKLSAFHRPDAKVSAVREGIKEKQLLNLTGTVGAPAVKNNGICD